MSATPQLISKLQVALANGLSTYLRAHGYHWNVVGSDFVQLHDLFGEIYEDVYSSLDPIAENLRKIGAFAPYTTSDLDKVRTITDVAMPATSAGMVQDLLGVNEQMISTLQQAFDAATAANEQGIANFLSERLDMHQKWSWQLRSTLGR